MFESYIKKWGLSLQLHNKIPDLTFDLEALGQIQDLLSPL